MTFKDNFRQGQVVGIDLKNQTVLLQGGEVSLEASNSSESFSGPETTVTPRPAWCWTERGCIIDKGLITAATQYSGNCFVSLSFMPGTVLSLCVNLTG